MSNETFLPCIQDRLVPGTIQQPNATQCNCQVFYSGQLCETRIPWFNAMHILRITYVFVLTTYILVWSLAKFIYELKQKKLQQLRLSAVALYALLLGTIGIVAHRINKASHFESVDYWYSTGSESNSYIVAAVFAALYIALFMVATNLIISFWFTILTAKMRPKLAWRTRLVSIAMAAIVFVCCPTGVMLTQSGFGQLFVVLIILPVLVNVVWFIIMTILVRCHHHGKTKKVDTSFHHKTQHATKIFGVLSGLWFFYLLYLAALSFFFLAFPAQKALTEIIMGFLNDTFEFGVQLCILYLIDRKGGVKRLFRAIKRGERIVDASDRSINEAATSSANGTSMGTKSSENTDAKSLTSVGAPANSLASFGDPKTITLGAMTSTTTTNGSSDRDADDEADSS